MIRLRTVVEDDRARLLAWRNRPDVRRWMYTDHVIGAEEHDRWFSEMLTDDTRRYWVVERRTRTGSGTWDGVGVVNLVGLTDDATACAFGIYLGEPVERGSGVGRAALFLALDAAFAQPGIGLVTAQALASNTAALATYERIGMHRVRLLEAHARKGDLDVDVVEVGVYRATWAHRRAAVADELRARGLVD